MPRKLLLLSVTTLALLSFAAFAVACNDDDDDYGDSATNTPSTEATPTAASATDLPATPAETDVPFAGGRDPVEGQAQGSGIPVLIDVRTGAHADYDRIAFEFEGAERPHYRVEYITPPATGCGTGEPVTVAGAAVLRVQFTPANAHNETGGTSVTQELTPSLTSLLEAKQICDFEADVQWALGISQEADFRVLELDNPPRIAVDVAN